MRVCKSLRRFVCTITAVFSMICCFAYLDAYALSEEEGKKILDDINSSMGRAADYNILMSVYAALKTTGFSDYESAAILVNMNRESSIKPDAGQPDGGGVGLIQWDDRKQTLQAYCKSKGDTKYSVTCYAGTFQIGDIGTQVAFMLEEFNGTSAAGGQSQWISKNPIASYGNSMSAPEDIKSKLNTTMDLATWRASTEVDIMSVFFTACFERCAFGIDIWGEGAKQAPDMYKLITGTEIKAGTTNEKVDQQLATALVNAGLWDESKFVDFCKLTESSLTFPDRSGLKYNQVHEISEWQQTVEHIKYDRAYRLPRQIFVFIGIVITVYATLLYVCFWFDRVNNFVDISLLSVLTFKRFQASYDDKLSNFADTTKSQKILAHRDIVKVSLTGILIGVLLLSGKLFNIVASIIAWLIDKIG